MFGLSDEEKAAKKREQFRDAIRQRQKDREKEYGGGFKSQAQKDAEDEEYKASHPNG